MALGSSFIELDGPRARHEELFFMGTNAEASYYFHASQTGSSCHPPGLNVPHEQETIANTSTSCHCSPGAGFTFTGL